MRQITAVPGHTSCVDETACGCPEQELLWARYRLAFKAYIDDGRRRKVSVFETQSSSTNARVEFEQEWDAYCQHLREHGCRKELLPFLFSRQADLIARQIVN